MGTSSHNNNKLGRTFNILLLGFHLIVFILLCLSGYGCMLHPSIHPWLVSASLAFGPILLVYCLLSLMWLFLHPQWFASSIIGLLLCSVPIRTYIPVNFSKSFSDGNIIKILSYNVNDFSKNDADKRTVILDFIHSNNADILCLQEANYLPSQKRMMDTIMSPWEYKDTTMFYYNTLSIYTRFPIIDKCKVQGPDAPHGAVIYRLKTETDTIVVINSHFISNAISKEDKTLFKEVVKQPTKEDTKSNIHYLARKVDEAGILRAQQSDTLIKYIKTLSHFPIILCGDFNDSPLSYVHSQLTYVLNDSFTRGGCGPGITYHEAGMFFRIDHILCSQHWNVLKSKVRSDIKGSDHYPICSWLQLDPPTQ